MHEVSTPPNEDKGVTASTAINVQNTQSQPMINEQGIVDYSPENSIERRKGMADEQNLDAKMLYTESAMVARHGNHAHNI